MVWGSMAVSAVGNLVFIDGMMERYVYKTILEENLLQSAEKLGVIDDFYFQQDNDPKHKSKHAMEFFDKVVVKCLDLVSQSPDMNPIEHLWRMMKLKLKNRRASNIEERKQQIQDVWEQMSPDLAKKLLHSMTFSQNVLGSETCFLAHETIFFMLDLVTQGVRLAVRPLKPFSLILFRTV